MSVTVPRIRNAPRVFICAACRLLADSRRSHSTTCCTACRVALHRRPAADLLVLARAAGVDLPAILDALAVQALRPDLIPRIVAGELGEPDWRPMVYAALMTRIAAILQRNSATGD